MDVKIKEMLSQGKTDAEIAAVVMEEQKDLDAKAIAELIASAKKSEEVQAELKRIADEADQKKADADSKKAVDKKIADQVDAHLKEIKSAGFGAGIGGKKEYKTFNHGTGKIETISKETSDVYEGFAKLLGAITSEDVSSAKAISREIDQDNKHLAISSKAANDPSVSDVAARGGYSVPTEVDMTISQLTYEKSVMLSLANTDNIVFESKIYPLMYGLVVADIADQTTAITEDQAVFTNPTVAMERAGVYSNISNTIINQKGADIVNAFTTAYASAFAEFLDTRLAIGNVTNASDLVDGIVFDTNSTAPTAIARTALTVQAMADIKNTLSDKATGNLAWVANRKITDNIGLLENTNGAYVFPGYVNGGNISPLGIPLMTNSKITSVLDIGGDNSTGGTDDVLVLADFSKVVAGVSGGTRIDLSKDYRFTNDVTTIRGIRSYGQKVLSASGTGGTVAVVQELTN